MTTAISSARTFNPAVHYSAPVTPAKKPRDPHFHLIEAAMAGNQPAYTAIVEQYKRMVFSLVYDMLNNRDEAEEVTQDAFVKAFRFLNSWRAESRFSTWLYRIAQSSALDHIRRKRLDTVSLDSPVATPLFKLYDDAPDAQQKLENGEKAVQLQRAMQQLLPEDYAVLKLFYLKEHSLEEICEIKDWTMSNAKSRLCRARRRLREVMEA